jgi:hypothetical protein
MLAKEEEEEKEKRTTNEHERMSRSEQHPSERCESEFCDRQEVIDVEGLEDGPEGEVMLKSNSGFPVHLARDGLREK